MFLNFGLIALLVVLQVRCLQPEGCDTKLNNQFREGILGQVSMFPWLGVIRVQLYEGVMIRIALTGAVLIKSDYALTVADDVARIPKRIFRRDSRALFYPHDGEPWLFKLMERLMHPEYPNIKNSIALIKLELENNGPAKLRPICWPTLLYNASDQLYVLGITDVNDVLEKEAYSVQYVRQYDCMVFYNKADLNDMDDLAKDYQCAYARNSNRSCIWETGMVLASNATGTWVLLGFGIRGPGCASPGRFIEIYQYLNWIDQSTTDLDNGENFNRDVSLRKSGYRKKSRILDVPVHHFFRSEDDIANVSQTTAWIFDWYELGIGEYGLNRIDKNAIILSKFMYDADGSDCLKKSKLLYTENTKIYADIDRTAGHGVATYSISLMDLSVKNFTCVIIRVDAYKKSKPQLWFSWGTYTEPLEGYETPGYLLKKYPIPRREKNETTTVGDQKGDKQTTTTAHTIDISDPDSFRKSGNKEKTTNLVPESIIKNLTDVLEDLINVLGSPIINDKFEAPIHDKLKEVLNELDKITDKQLPGYGPDFQQTKDDIKLCKNQLELSYYYKRHRVYYCINKLGIARKHLRLMKTILTTTTSTTSTTTTTTTTTSTTPKPGEKRTTSTTTSKYWIPHKNLEAAYLTENPSRLSYPPFLNLLLEFEFYKEAELKLEVWSHMLKETGVSATPAPTARTRFRHKNSTIATLIDPSPKSTTTPPTPPPEIDPDSLLKRAENVEVEIYRRDELVEDLKNACDIVKLESVYVISITIVFCSYWL